MKLLRRITSATSPSKYLAFVLIITLMAVGFYLGIKNRNEKSKFHSKLLPISITSTSDQQNATIIDGITYKIPPGWTITDSIPGEFIRINPSSMLNAQRGIKDKSEIEIHIFPNKEKVAHIPNTQIKRLGNIDFDYFFGCNGSCLESYYLVNPVHFVQFIFYCGNQCETTQDVAADPFNGDKELLLKSIILK